MPSTFERKKNSIVAQLQVPDIQYSDLSPKGTLDVDIRPLIHNVNSKEGLVTTSSCAGRISVFLEGKRKNDSPVIGENIVTSDEAFRDLSNKSGGTSVGGKGRGGRWLYVSHDPIPLPSGDIGGVPGFTELFGLSTSGREFPHSEDTRYVHFKFEPMILHVLTASLEHAQTVLTAASQAGFRESGAVNITSNPDGETTPMVAVRSMGLAFDSIIGCLHNSTDRVPETIFSLVGEPYLRSLVEIGNMRFRENAHRIERFAKALDIIHPPGVMAKPGEREWEDTDTRRERKRAEGLRKRLALQEARRQSPSANGSGSEYGATVPYSLENPIPHEASL
ncbi:hypothetical protein FGG08_002471 [Glutinoglossum americanum]|uniref:tRNA(Phe) 7-[(3-amino-3-carboxypropyl)-4-demethylwyosine(37)-N(4)]-methyltransferase n=1 Tax=Glutinoglossum americanum TaxID=1670608 RepID=A0A9P8I4T0_9PEZI|nr:hypothetical protein FGG08_002471 [Glutinoglossum americanum]